VKEKLNVNLSLFAEQKKSNMRRALKTVFVKKTFQYVIEKAEN
jgi:hypothetical protein